jgi:hypothetical protein
MSMRKLVGFYFFLLPHPLTYGPTLRRMVYD